MMQWVYFFLSLGFSAADHLCRSSGDRKPISIHDPEIAALGALAYAVILLAFHFGYVTTYGQLLLAAIWFIGHSGIVKPLGQFKHKALFAQKYRSKFLFSLGLVIHFYGHVLNVVGSLRALGATSGDHDEL